MDTNNNSTNNISQTIWVGISQVIIFSIALINAAILSRYFDKTEYGTYRQILYVYTTLLTLFSAGLYGAYSYFLPKQSPQEGKDFVIRQIKIFICLGFLFSLTLFLLAPVIADIFRNSELEKGLRLFSVVPLLMLPTTGVESVYATIRKTHILAIYTSLTRLFILLLITLPVIILKGTYITAVWGWIISSFITFLIAIYLILRPFKDVKRVPTSFPLKDVFRFSIPLMLTTLYGIAIKFADQFYVSRYYGTEVFAEFSNGFIDLPFVAMLVGSTTIVLLPLFSKYSGAENGKVLISQTMKNSIEKSVILAYPLLVFFLFNSKNTIIAMYGDQYEASSVYFSIGIFLGFFNIVTIMPVLFSLGKTRLLSRIDLSQAIAIWIAGFFIVHLSGSPLLYAVFSRLFFVGQICAGIFFAAKNLGIRISEMLPFRMMAKTVVHSALICWPVTLILSFFKLNVFVTLGFSALLSAGFVILSGGFFGLPYVKTINSILVNIPVVSSLFFKRRKSRISSDII